jgi:cytochrome P450
LYPLDFQRSGRLVAARDLESGAAMTIREVRDEVVIIFHCRARDYCRGHGLRLVSALETSLGGGENFTRNLPYTRQVIQEAMRLYPPAPGLEARKAAADDVVCGHRIPKGTQAVIMPWVLHRHQTLWDEPDRFEPDRFSPENSARRDRFAWLPFGGGPRICIGAALALTEASLILATAAQRFRFGFVKDQQITLKARITLRPGDGIKLTVEPGRQP